MNSLMSAAICLEIVRIKLATCVNNIVTYENCDSNDTLRLALKLQRQSVSISIQ
jgi:hypothetical protein